MLGFKAFYNKPQICQVNILTMRVLQIWILMGIICQERSLDLEKHMFQWAPRTTSILLPSFSGHSWEVSKDQTRCFCFDWEWKEAESARVTRQRGTERKPVWTVVPWSNPDFFPYMALFCLSTSFSRVWFSQPVAQASRNHVSTWLSCTLGQHTQVSAVYRRRYIQLFVKGSPWGSTLKYLLYTEDIYSCLLRACLHCAKQCV